MTTHAIDAYSGTLGNYQARRNQASSMEDFLAGGEAAQSRDSGSLKERLHGRIQSLLAKVPHEGGRLSFQDVIDHRDGLREEFEALAKEDLAALGVDTDRDFTLSYDAATDTVTADPAHPDKKTIDAYFADNAQMRERFAQVVTYSNLLKPAETKVSPEMMIHEMRMQAMNVWFSDNLPESGLAGYGSLLFTQAGGSQYFGLDLRV